MSEYFNDSPIETPKDDRYGITPFAESIAKSITNIAAPEGTVIALHGPWGSGKSSAVNLIRNALDEARDENLVVTEFKGWWYSGDEALVLAFLQDLHSTLSKGLGEKVKDFIPKLTRRVLQAGQVVGTIASTVSGQPFLGGLISKAADFAGIFFSDSETAEETFHELAGVLRKSDRRFLIIIDDIDRLNPDEALAVFRLVKSVGRLPNVMYLLAFDRDLAERLVRDRYPSEGPHFIEKIVQAGFELPSPLQTDLNDALLASVGDICGSPDEAQMVRTMNIFYDVVAPYITTPRHVTRFRNAITVTWPAIANEVNLADFIALETLRLYEPGLFNAIRLHKSKVCGTRQEGDPRQRDDASFNAFLQSVPDSRHELAKVALQRLFPRLENMGYGEEWIIEWSSERRVCVEAHFDTYFRLSLSDEVLSSRQIDELIERADDRDYIQETLQQVAVVERKGGKSMVPVYIDELTTHARRVEMPKVEPLLSALFEVHDKIDLQKDDDRGFMAIANTTLRIHWLIRRLTRDRFSIGERTALYMAATETASLGWLIDFVRSAKGDYSERPNRPPRREEDCLVASEALEPLTNRAVEAIRAAAADGSLLHHRDLSDILYRWRDFLDGDPAEVRVWTDDLMNDDNAVVTLARAMTSQSWSMGMGLVGLGDRVARASTTVQISDETDIVDVTAFRVALERIRDEGRIEAEALEDVQNFLEAWDRKRRGDED